MKIRVKININSIVMGSIVDAAVNNDFSTAIAFDINNVVTWLYSGQFEVITETTIGYTPNSQQSLRDFLGQDIKSLEFK